jgi:hypothetical protein
MAVAWTAPAPEDEFVVWDDDETLDPAADAPEVVRSFAERSVPFSRDPTDPDGSGLRALLRGRRAAREAAGAFDAGGHPTVLIPSSPAADSDLPNAARAVLARCRKALWDVEAQTTRVAVSTLVYVGTTEGHNQGDVRTPAHEVVYFGIQGVLELPAGIAAAFWATWARKEIPGKKAGNAFESAVYWDPVNGRLPALGATEFDEWLAIFAPRLEKRKARDA